MYKNSLTIFSSQTFAFELTNQDHKIKHQILSKLIPFISILYTYTLFNSTKINETISIFFLSDRYRDLPDSDDIIRVSSEQGLSINRPGE